VLFALSASLGAQEETAESRAEKVRNALIDRAFSSPAHVTSSAWLDESGQLRHVTRIYSELRARAAADFAEPDGARAPAAASGAAAAPAAASAPAPAPAMSKGAVSDQAGCHTPSRGLRRLAEMHLQAHPWDGARGYAVVSEFEQILRRTVTQLASTGELALAPTAGRTQGSYERLLTRQDAHAVPYRIEASIAPAFPPIDSDDASPFPRWPWQRDVTVPGQHFELSLGLREIATGRMLNPHRVPIYLPARPTLVGSPEVPDSVHNALQMAIFAWWSQAKASLLCEPLQLVTQGDPGAGQVLIPLGASAGVRVGDRWVLEDRARVPGRVLEEGALERSRVAEVIVVTPHRAVLKLTQHEQAASMPAERGVPWFATPM
jgi:hypothetical protein